MRIILLAAALPDCQKLIFKADMMTAIAAYERVQFIEPQITFLGPALQATGAPIFSTQPTVSIQQTRKVLGSLVFWC
jgi:hypothetical protein